MNNRSSFENLSLEELERRCGLLARERNLLETRRQVSENELRQIQQSRRKLRDEIQNIIEQLAAKLLPELSDDYLKELERFFPNEETLRVNIKTAKLSLNVSFWQKILNFFAKRTNSAQVLEQLRILLRDILWRLNAMPPAAGKKHKEFGVLLNKKTALTNFEKSAIKKERSANQIIEQFKELSEKLEACQNAVKRRRNVQHRPVVDNADILDDATDFDSDDEDYSSADNDSGTTGNYSSNDSSYQEKTEESSSTPTIEAAAVWSGFEGGGGGFDGGGAGGSWENYS